MKLEISNESVEQYRPEKQQMDPMLPYLSLNERELQADGSLKSVNTIFLTNRECPFKCVMCDLWRHTLDEPTPKGAIPNQIKIALSKLPNAEVVKLYNSGNFFDGKAIPREDYQEIAELLEGYDHVIVENHPKLIGPFISRFKNMLRGSFEIAMGLETIHPIAMPKLNKQITKKNFERAVLYLNEQEIASRAFILLNPPFITDSTENRKWCIRSVKFAFESGVSSCTIIPTREGNGMMEKLRESGNYTPPNLTEIENVFDEALKLKRGRVFCDVWDLQLFTDCDICYPLRKQRLEQMNLTQEIQPRFKCNCNE